MTPPPSPMNTLEYDDIDLPFPIPDFVRVDTRLICEILFGHPQYRALSTRFWIARWARIQTGRCESSTPLSWRRRT